MARSNEMVNWTGVAVAIVVLLVLGWIVGTREAPTQEATEQQLAAEQLVETKVLSTVSYEGQEGKTVLELLQASHQVEVQQTDLGALVTKIDGVGDEPNAYWLYYVDGQQAPMAADNFVTENGQQIEWRYEQF